MKRFEKIFLAITIAVLNIALASCSAPPEPTVAPTLEPTEEATVAPTAEPTEEPTVAPTPEPTEESTVAPTAEPTAEPTEQLPHVEVIDRFTIKIFAQMPKIDAEWHIHTYPDRTSLFRGTPYYHIVLVNDEWTNFHFIDSNWGHIFLYNAETEKNFPFAICDYGKGNKLPLCVEEEYTYDGLRPKFMTIKLGDDGLPCYILCNKDVLWEVQSETVLDAFYAFDMESCRCIRLESCLLQFDSEDLGFESHFEEQTLIIPEDYVLEGKTIEEIYRELGGKPIWEAIQWG